MLTEREAHRPREDRCSRRTAQVSRCELESATTPRARGRALARGQTQDVTRRRRATWGRRRAQSRLAELRRGFRLTSGRARKLHGLAILLRPYRLRLALMVVSLLLATGASLAPPPLAKLAIDEGIIPGDIARLDFIIVGFLAASMIYWAASSAQTYLVGWIGQRVLQDLRIQLFSHLQSMTIAFHSRNRAGVLISRMTNDVEALNRLVSEGVVVMFQATLVLCGTAIVLLLLDVRLALITLAMVPFLAIAGLVFRLLSAEPYRRAREEVTAITAYLHETLSGIRVVRAFAQETRHVQRFAELTHANRRANMATVHLGAAYYPSIELLSTLMTVAILVVGGLEVIDEQMRIGVIVAFLIAQSNLTGAIEDLSELHTLYQQGMAALDGIFELLEEEPDVRERPGALVLDRLSGEICFEDVSFSYGPAGGGVQPGDRRWALRGIDLVIPPGQTVALVGATGAGKSTLARLVSRFYDPTEGMVRIDGHDLRDVQTHSLRSQMALVPQEGFLFSGTIRENIVFGRPAASEAEVATAAAGAGAADFIAGLERGYDTQVGERGVSLSAGERQLMAIARALIADPRILILDEASSNVDILTEARLEQGLRRLLEGRTVIVIAHRLSTVRRAERIVVLHGGRVIEQGTHTQLLDAAGRYAALYHAWDDRVTG